MIIAIDGPAGSGKTTTARKVAKSLGFIHINTGAMYRGITLQFIREKINLSDVAAMQEILQTTKFDFAEPHLDALNMNGENISTEISTSFVTEKVSRISSISKVRKKMVEYQRQMSKGKNVVLEGRDIGTIVFPNADYKFYLIADIQVRTQRRKKEMEAAGEHKSFEEVLLFLRNRDQQDSSRQHAPLMKAEDAIELDTTELSIDEQVNYIINIVNQNQKGA
jgi:cytidylate kinase